MDTKTWALEMRREAEKLLKAADVLEGKTTSEQISTYSQNSQAKVAIKGKRGLPPKISGVTRLEQLTNLLKDGPLAFNEIVEAGIPRGTASSLMTNDNGFTKDSVGRWILKDNLSI